MALRSRDLRFAQLKSLYRSVVLRMLSRPLDLFWPRSRARA
jgi:site-specific recombinase